MIKVAIRVVVGGDLSGSATGAAFDQPVAQRISGVGGFTVPMTG